MTRGGETLAHPTTVGGAPAQEARPLVVGHRGAPLQAPGNTLDAIRQAVDRGADMVEVDVRATADGHLALHHDRKLSGHRLTRLTLDEARSLARTEAGFELATLPQALEALDGAPIDVELKTKDHALQAVETIREHRPAEGTMVSSFSPRPLKTVAETAPEIRTGLLLSPARALRLLYRRHRARILQRRADAVEVDVLIPHKSFLALRLLGALHATEREILFWTVNRDRRLRRVLAHPLVDGVITDRTARAVHLRRAQPGGPPPTLDAAAPA